jgi:Mg2+ and Co2+ transporter CorA
MTTTIHVRTATGVRNTSDLSEVRALLENEEVFWIDTSSIDEPLRRMMTEVLKLHPLAVEDILLDRPGPEGGRLRRLPLPGSSTGWSASRATSRTC